MRRALLAVVVSVGVAWSAAACAEPADLQADAASELQAAVAEVVTAAEQGRHEAARDALDAAREVLAAAADEGRLSVARYRSIDDALTRVEAELDALLQAAAEQAAAEQAAAEQAAAEQAAAEQAAAEQAAAEQAARDGKDDRGDDDKGRGNGGKGRGRDD